METHLAPLKPRRQTASAPTGRYLSVDRCVDLMASRYQWAETTRVNAHHYLGQGRFHSFCSARGISSVSQLSNEAVLEFMADMRDKVGVSRNTLRRYRNYFRRLADFCADTPGFENPRFTPAGIPKAPKAPRGRRPDALTVGEEAALVAAVAGSRRDSLLIRLMLACGLRVSEVCALCVDDVKLTARPPRVLVTKGHSDITKSGLDRQVTFRQPYTADLTKDLEAWVARYRPTSQYPHLFLAERRASARR